LHGGEIHPAAARKFAIHRMAAGREIVELERTLKRLYGLDEARGIEDSDQGQADRGARHGAAQGGVIRWFGLERPRRDARGRSGFVFKSVFR
jgi:hypothetical protein